VRRRGAEWYGKPLSARALSRLLEPYRIRPTLHRVSSGPTRGYFRSDFTDAWARYVPPRETDTSDTSGTTTLWDGPSESEEQLLEQMLAVTSG
jgi:hypothetical protein